MIDGAAEFKYFEALVINSLGLDWFRGLRPFIGYMNNTLSQQTLGAQNRFPKTGGSHQDQILPIRPEINQIRRTASLVHRFASKGNAPNRGARKS